MSQVHLREYGTVVGLLRDRLSVHAQRSVIVINLDPDCLCSMSLTPSRLLARPCTSVFITRMHMAKSTIHTIHSSCTHDVVSQLHCLGQSLISHTVNIKFIPAKMNVDMFGGWPRHAATCTELCIGSEILTRVSSFKIIYT